MSDQSIIDKILLREGAEYTNDPSDRGGATKYGITQRAWETYIAKDPSNAPARDVEVLTEPMARKFYLEMYLEPLAFIANDNLRELAVDCAVNHGSTRAIKWLQQAAGLWADGVIGPKTTAFFAAPATLGAYSAHMEVYKELLKTRFRFYARIATDQGPGDPDAKFLPGWINRACEFIR